MNEREQKYIELLEEQKMALEVARQRMENQYNQASGFNAERQPNMIQYQLDVQDELDRLYHLLSGHIVKKDTQGNEFWDEPEDDRLKIFSDYGVKQIMNILSFYINKNILLSNFKEEDIFWKVHDFGMELLDLVYCRYEVFFHYPTPEDLYDKVIETVEANYQLFPHLMIQNGDGTIEIDQHLLYKKCVQWSKEELQSKYRHFPMIIQALIDSVHATYLRAMNGEERESLRKQYNIHETLSNQPMMQQQKPGVISRWFT